MTERQRSALVVLNPGQRPDADMDNEIPPSVVRKVMASFISEGFEVGPFVGISFAITGPQALFDRVFGVDPLSDDFAGPELPTDRLDGELVPHIAAVTVTEPPAFGPGNP
jgi:hypothetical protein